MKILLMLILFPVLCFSQTQKDLIGSWQAAPHVAAGYDDTYTFNGDGTFYYFSNQMDCSKREIGFGGYWELDGKTIHLTITYYEIEKGGWLEPSNGSCGSDSMLVGSVIVRTFSIPYAMENLKIANYKTETEDETQRYTIELNNRKYWHFSKFEY
ncbi:MAG: hypothetical protein K8I03_03965 [Ignavibacteria bacterium]|nr:hypothetical protein [Ignavibacteria bacterium]